MSQQAYVGIDLGTTYSCVAVLNSQGTPETLPNSAGELSTPSVVLFDDGEVTVGTEALRNSIRAPHRVVSQAKRYMGDPSKTWTVEGTTYTPTDIASLILKSLLSDASARAGEITEAVVTVPAQFSDAQRQATILAGQQAGLKRVHIINEPVAAALCHVIGDQGLWFAELADPQTVLVCDLGGGTFDLSLVKYTQDEVRVIASGGDLRLGGLDWNDRLIQAVSEQFEEEFGQDPRQDPESLQALSLEVESVKRSLSVRPRAALTVQHGGRRKSYQIEADQFEELARDLLERMRGLTTGLLKDNKMGWARVDTVLTTGGASRMPMVQRLLKQLSGRTLNTTLSPDQSIAQGAAYYAAMVATDNRMVGAIQNSVIAERLEKFRMVNVCARSLGILVRTDHGVERVPHYLIAANSAIPAKGREIVGTMRAGQRRVHLHIVESGTAADERYVELGDCVVNDLPSTLPAGAEVEVTIEYDAEARVHVSAKMLATGQTAHAEIVRPESITQQKFADDAATGAISSSVNVSPPPPPRAALSGEGRSAQSTEGRSASPVAGRPVSSPPAGGRPQAAGARPVSPPPVPAPRTGQAPRSPVAPALDLSENPVALCNECGEPLGSSGRCTRCTPPPLPRGAAAPKSSPESPVAGKPSQRPVAPRPTVQPAAQPSPRPLPGKPAARPVKQEADPEPMRELPAAKGKPGTKGEPAPGKKPVAGKPKPTDDDDIFFNLFDED